MGCAFGMKMNTAAPRFDLLSKTCLVASYRNAFALDGWMDECKADDIIEVKSPDPYCTNFANSTPRVVCVHHLSLENFFRTYLLILSYCSNLSHVCAIWASLTIATV